MRYRSRELDGVVGAEIMEENGKLRGSGVYGSGEILNGSVVAANGTGEEQLATDILNPFVHRLELDTTYDKFKEEKYSPYLVRKSFFTNLVAAHISSIIFSGAAVAHEQMNSICMANLVVTFLSLAYKYLFVSFGSVGQAILLTIALLPIRLMAITALVIMAWLLACVGLHGMSEEDLRRAPLKGWRRDLRGFVCWLMRIFFVCGGFHNLKVKGQQAGTKEAPILALAPHSSFFDALPVVYLGAPSIVAKAETRQLPFFGMVPWLCLLGRWTYQAGGMKIVVRGKQASRAEAPILVVAPHSTFIDGGIIYVTGFPSIIVRRESGLNPYIGKLINYTQPVYVWRDDPNSRQNTVKEIIERATSKEDWPQVMIFPEGTCTNRSCLITFKSGAFYPGVPVQPVCIRYPNKLDTVTWTWEGPGALKLLWLTLTQLNTSCEIEFLPVYKPSEAEKLDPKLYANNVRRLMAEALKIPVSDYTYDDCRIISKAHQLHIPNASTIVETHKLRFKLGLLKENIEEELVQKNCHGLPDMVDFHKFAQLLMLDENNPSAQYLFKINDKHNRGVIDFEEYLFTVMAIANANSELDMVRIAFEVCKSNANYTLNSVELRKALLLSLSIGPEESDRIFQQISREFNCNTVSHDMVLTVLSTRPELQHLFSETSEAKRKKSI